ncbi:hypothetical protein NP233_g12928 [Leucocoprinus birnbaumii]|uniref:DUF6532 domain-containing protein n=1 Tax=Leucocoprinus birnbaumii TaxID=56174 RepID=A0AAD5YML9_9AGAR|nr:hypothetical protein NP233_g12928 [Leucocoprinus birnbaumii]
MVPAVAARRWERNKPPVSLTLDHPSRGLIDARLSPLCYHRRGSVAANGKKTKAPPAREAVTRKNPVLPVDDSDNENGGSNARPRNQKATEDRGDDDEAEFSDDRDPFDEDDRDEAWQMEGEDDADMAGMPDDELNDLFGQEGAQVLGGTTKKSSSRNVPPSVNDVPDDDNEDVEQSGDEWQEEGLEDDNDDDEELEEGEGVEELEAELEEDGEDEIPNHSEGRRRKAVPKSHRDQRFADESAIVKDKPSKASRIVKKKGSVGKFPWTTIKWTTGDKPKMKVQHHLIRRVCHTAIEAAELTMATVDAWPECGQREDYRQQVLIEACRDLVKDEPKIRDIRVEIENSESKFCMFLGNWVVDRLSHHRSAMYSAGLHHIAGFRLGEDESCVHRVEQLRVADMYIYPGEWGPDERNPNKEKWIHEANKIYQNKAIQKIIRRAFFRTPGAFGQKYKHHFKSSHPVKEQPEVPMSIIALAATGLYAGLVSWETGDFITEKFEGERFKSTYDRHIEYLQSIQADNVNAYHKIASDLYNFVTQNLSGTGPRHHVGNALAVADFSGYDQ